MGGVSRKDGRRVLEISDLDVLLIRRISRGDSKALGELYDRYGGLLLGVARKILPDREASEDLVHDVFMEVWRSAADFDPSRGSVRAWLLVRTRSRALDRNRSSYATKITIMEDLQPLERPVPLEEEPQLAPDRTNIRVALQQLPQDQRQVIELGYFEGMSSAEIASHIGIPIGTVKSRVATALQKLRGVMGGVP
jgi:RNA polymerase sigma-70 factor (ECF subfamily)